MPDTLSTHHQKQHSKVRFVRPEVMKRLAEATRDEHRHIEANPLLADLMQVAQPLDHYRRTLKGFYGFYRPLEEGLLSVPCIGTHPEFESRLHKRHLLAQDLQRLGLSVEQLQQLPRCQSLSMAYTWPEVLGTLYVMEGATLGGQMIRRHLISRLEPRWHQALGFYDCYQDQVGQRWRRFQLLVAEHLAEDTDGQQLTRLIDAARRTFVQLDEWLAWVNVQTPEHQFAALA